MLAALAAALIWLTAGGAMAMELSCADAAAQAERGEGLPSGLLLAIGLVETGRIDAKGRQAPWAWTVQGGGAGRFFNTADEALAATRRLQAGGVQSIDIGCFQVNLHFHPDAFPDLARGFDPLTNAMAAARFLTFLHGERGSWEQAVAAYHSRTAALGDAYRDQVLSTWRTPPDGRAPILFGVQVWGPTGSLLPAAAATQARMPRVIIPRAGQPG